MIRARAANGLTYLAVALSLGAAMTPLTNGGDAPKPSYRWEKPILWDDKEGPEPREHGTVIVDEKRHRALLIGGLGYQPAQFTPLEDVWQLSLKTDQWVRLRPTTKVPAGGSRRVAEVPGRQAAYLFGGLMHNYLVEVDFSQETPAFSEVAQDNAPAPRGLHAFAYDPKLDRFVLFGGLTSDEDGRNPVVLNDIWTMKLEGGRAKWTEVKIKGGPSPRAGFAHAYDTKDGQLIVFGGSQSAIAPSNEASDTWALHLREDPPTWYQWKDGAPPARRNACFVWDQDEQRLFVCGGAMGANELVATDLQVLDTTPASPRWRTWTLTGSLSGRASGFAFTDPARGRVLMGFGNSDRTYRDLYPLKYK